MIGTRAVGWSVEVYEYPIDGIRARREILREPLVLWATWGIVLLCGERNETDIGELERIPSFIFWKTEEVEVIGRVILMISNRRHIWGFSQEFRNGIEE